MKRREIESESFINQLIKPLSHEKRFKTFLILSEGPKNIGELSMILGAKRLAVAGWLRELERAGLVKYRKKAYELTGKGRAWMGYLDGADVISKYGDFLNMVAMDRIPSKFIGIIKSLKKCEPHPEPEPITLSSRNV